jgi:hypothetical protein
MVNTTVMARAIATIGVAHMSVIASLDGTDATGAVANIDAMGVAMNGAACATTGGVKVGMPSRAVATNVATNHGLRRRSNHRRNRSPVAMTVAAVATAGSTDRAAVNVAMAHKASARSSSSNDRRANRVSRVPSAYRRNSARRLRMEFQRSWAWPPLRRAATSAR